MNVTLEALKDAASGLPLEDQAALAQYLLHSLKEDELADVQAEWLALAVQRMADVKAGKVIGIPAEEVFRSLRERAQ